MIETKPIISKIYFSHSVKDYNTEYELNITNQIKTKYPDAIIINPKDIKIDPEDIKNQAYPGFMKRLRKYFFPEIDKCDIMIVAKSKTGKYGSGAKKEIEYVNNKNNVNNEEYTLQDIEGNIIEQLSKNTQILIEDLNIPYPNPNRPTINCYWCKKQILEEDMLFCGEDESGDGRTYGCEECAGV